MPEERPITPRQRTREQLPSFQNVVGTGRASCEVPRYANTLYRINLRLGGTTFTKAMISEIRVRLGSKTLYLVSGPDLDKINNYKPLNADVLFLTVDFTQPRAKDRGAEFIGGLDLAALPDGKLFIEVNIVGATAPTLSGVVTWGPPQANKLISRLLQYNWSSGIGTGKQSVPLSFGGAMVQRIFILYTGTDWSASANGNVSRVEVKKNGRTEWDLECLEARFQQKEYLHVPQAKVYVVDFTLDNRVDGVLQTADARSLEVNAWLTAADNLTVYAETLDTPENN